MIFRYISYTSFGLNNFFTNRKSYLSSKTLLEYEKTLDGSGFLRVHKSHIINVNFVKSYNKGGYIMLNDGAEIEISPTYKEEFLRNFK